MVAIGFRKALYRNEWAASSATFCLEKLPTAFTNISVGWLNHGSSTGAERLAPMRRKVQPAEVRPLPFEL
jgi:hypothetical protein